MFSEKVAEQTGDDDAISKYEPNLSVQFEIFVKNIKKFLDFRFLFVAGRKKVIAVMNGLTSSSL